MKSLLLFLCGSMLFGAALSADVQPGRLSFETSAVVGSGFAPRKQVVLFACSSPPQPYARRMLSYLQIITADNQGGFRWEAPEPIAHNSVWFAIGSGSADPVVAVPGDDAPPRATLAAPSLLAGRETGGDALSIDAYMTDVLVVRPNDSVWFGTAIRHGASDLNRGLPGLNSFSIKGLKAHGTSNEQNAPATSLDHLTPSDVVVIVDPLSLRFYDGRLSAN